MATTTATQIQQLYVGLLGRAADQGGLNWWVEEVTTGGRTLEDIRASFVTSTEYTTTYGAATTRTDLVTAIYSNLFERTPSADELAYWVSTDTRPADQLVTAFLEFASTADQAVINNKTFVAQTYTDTVGDTNFNAAGAAAAIANVDGTPASVATAIAAISNGTLDGQVPGVNAINALASAQTEVTAFEEANQAAADAFVTKLGLDPEDYATYEDALVAAAKKADTVRGSGDSTAVLIAKAGDEAKATAAAYADLTITAKAQADKLVSAIAAEATAKAAGATAVQKAAVEAGLKTDVPASFGDSRDKYADAAAVYSAYVLGDADARKLIDAYFKDSAYYSTFKATVTKDAAYADALKATAAAKDALDSDTKASVIVEKVNGITVVAAKDTAVGTGNGYLAKQALKTTADKNLAAATKADADIATAKALQDAYAVKTDAVDSAQKAVDALKVAGSVDVIKLDGTSKAGTGTEAAPIKDVFYFADKSVAADPTKDFSITSFAAGDNIVLGNGYTFNNGALSAGDNNKLEFFLVKSDAGVQIVLETANYGSSDVKANATTGVIDNTVADHATVITLTGVTAEHVSVANGVVSYV
ncbi:DUF4214 domain-containing protein [Pseudomonas lactis]|uniref:DUF4214 domain-containing protein n=1 Tax=Pseudomonas lactis TaxID=1615674 RepID=UPI00190BB9A3|nr:DUF4214 domain-containing protein [Pseudomonas lactis]MBK3444150.1 DUF4214 domain-containing protein [Pseudomonas lactis]